MSYSRVVHLALLLLLLLLAGWLPAPIHSFAPTNTPVLEAQLTWTHLSTETGDLPLPSSSQRQAATLILDIDQDGLNDFVIASQRDVGAAVIVVSTSCQWLASFFD